MPGAEDLREQVEKLKRMVREAEQKKRVSGRGEQGDKERKGRSESKGRCDDGIGCWRASGQGDGLCNACGTAGTVRHVCGDSGVARYGKR